ncbi:MAG: sensor domain-containing diguanylate cyclase [Desulfitobacteriaceae bacterium]
MVLTALILGLCFWILDLFMDKIAVPHGNWHRLVVLAIIVTLGVYAHLQEKRNKKILKVLEDSEERHRSIFESPAAGIEERYRSIFENSLDGIILSRESGEVIEANPAACSMFQRSAEEILGYGREAIVDVSDPRFRVYLEQRAESGKARSEFYMKRKDDSRFVVEAYSSVFKDKNGEILISAIVRDITDRIRTEEELRSAKEEAERLARTIQNDKLFQDKILQTAATPIATVDSSSVIITANDEFCSLLGYTQKELVGVTCYSLGWDNCNGSCQLLRLGNHNSVYKVQCSIVTKDGRELEVLRNGSVIFDDSGEISGGIISFVDITPIIEAKAEVEKALKLTERLAQTDYLTNLLNRRAFMKRLEEEYNRAIRTGKSFGLIFTDIDKFKKVNDTYGHQAGDIVLQEFTACFLTQCRPYDFVGRYGGEEFVVCLPDSTGEQVARIAERMRHAIEELRIVLFDRKEINVTASFGVVALDTSDSIDSLISRADELLYRAKAQAGNKVYMG